MSWHMVGIIAGFTLTVWGLVVGDEELGEHGCGASGPGVPAPAEVGPPAPLVDETRDGAAAA